jgi:hypothetical protein
MRRGEGGKGPQAPCLCHKYASSKCLMPIAMHCQVVIGTKKPATSRHSGWLNAMAGGNA